MADNKLFIIGVILLAGLVAEASYLQSTPTTEAPAPSTVVQSTTTVSVPTANISTPTQPPAAPATPVRLSIRGGGERFDD